MNHMLYGDEPKETNTRETCPECNEGEMHVEHDDYEKESTYTCDECGYQYTI